MEDSHNRVLMLGRLQQPREVQLSLPRKVQYSENTVPLSKVAVKVQRHFGQDGLATSLEELSLNPPMPTSRGAAVDLEAFWEKSRQRAAEVEREMKRQRESGANKAILERSARLTALKEFNEQVHYLNTQKAKLAAEASRNSPPRSPTGGPLVQRHLPEPPAPQPALAEPIDTNQPPPQPPAKYESAALQARRRLLAHSRAAAAAMRQAIQAAGAEPSAPEHPFRFLRVNERVSLYEPNAAEKMGAPLWQPQCAIEEDYTARQAAGLVRVPPQPALVQVPSGPSADALPAGSEASGSSLGSRKGRAAPAAGPRLPRVPGPYATLDAKFMKRVVEAVAERRAALPALCGCGHGGSPLDLWYPYRCTTNCQLHDNPKAYESLLLGTLEAQGLL